MSGWVWLISDVNGLPHRVPEGVVAFHAARGFQVTDIDGELDSDSEEFAAALGEWQGSEEVSAGEESAVLETTDEAKSATETQKDEVNG